MRDEKISSKLSLRLMDYRTVLSRGAFFILHFSFFILLVSCNKTKIIPDDELAEIFRDALVTNAYTQSQSIKLDSLNIYEPIFAKYGYTSEDVQFTIGSFAKRKSARMSHVVDRTIEMLAADARFYKRRVEIVDSIGQLARDRYASVVYTDTLIQVRRIADTARLRITIPVERTGTYEVSYWYMVDSTDKNNNLRVSHYLMDERGRQSANNTRRLKRAEKERFTGTFAATDSHRKLVLDLNGYPKEDMERPSLTIDSLVVKLYLPDREARDAMARSIFDYGVDTLADPLRWVPQYDPQVYIVLPDEKNLVTPAADTAGTPAG